MKMEIYGCKFKEKVEMSSNFLFSFLVTPYYYDTLEELLDKERKLINRRIEDTYNFIYRPDMNSPIFLSKYTVDKFDSTEKLKIDNKEHAVLHHYFNPETNTQTVIIDKEMKKEPLDIKEKEVLERRFNDEKQCDLEKLKRYKEKLETERGVETDTRRKKSRFRTFLENIGWSK